MFEDAIQMTSHQSPLCKNTFHRDDCAADPSLLATLVLATSQGWQRCFACKALVELIVGCYHMT